MSHTSMFILGYVQKIELPSRACSLISESNQGAVGSSHRHRVTTKYHLSAKRACPSLIQVRANLDDVEMRRPKPSSNGPNGTFVGDPRLVAHEATNSLMPYHMMLVEKILRVQPDVKQLYLLIQPRAGVTPEQRVDSHILDLELFRVLRAEYGDKYEEFMKKKITAVGGNVRSQGLGISPEQTAAIAPILNLIVHAAANTRFDQRYDVALQDNTLGPTNVMKFAHTCPILKLFLHVSTAYVNGDRRGSVLEKPFEMGDKKIQDLVSEKVETKARLWSKDLPNLDIDFERKLAEIAAKAAKLYAESDSNIEKEMSELGAKRAQMFGWPDVYTFSKAMGEIQLLQNRGNIPLAIVRPSTVISTYKEPFRGWIEGIRMIDPLALIYGRGQIPGLPGTEDCSVDLIPVDLVVNTVLAVMTKHYGREQMKNFVYQSSSGSLNPLTKRELVDSFYNHFKAYPMVDKQGNEIRVERCFLIGDAEEFEQFEQFNSSDYNNENIRCNNCQLFIDL